MVNDAMLPAVECLLECSRDTSEMVLSIEDVILAPNTIMKRIESISHCVLDQLMDDLKTCEI